MIDDLLEYNRAFVAQNGYEKYVTNKYPDKKIAALDEKKTVRDLKLSDCVIDLVEQEESYVHAFDNNNEEVDNIKFEGSISIPKLLSDIFSDMKDDYFVTLKESSIVLVKDITSSTDVTSRIIIVIYYV